MSRESGSPNRRIRKLAGSFGAIILALLAVTLIVWALRQLPASAPAPRLDPDLGVPIGEPLLSTSIHEPPVMDGVVEAIWDQATPLNAPLTYGLHGDEPAGSIELRSLYDKDNVYFLARWPAETSGGEPGVWRNLATLHWRLVSSGQVSGESIGSDGLACTVGCHTATADGQGDLVGIRAETIPPGLDEDLYSGGGWSEGEWLLEWSRPRVSASPYDQNLTDPAQGYRFFFKLFLGLDDRPDPVSKAHELRLGQ